MNQEEKIAQLLSRLEKLTQVATQQQIEIALLKKDISSLISQSLQDGTKPISHVEDKTPVLEISQENLEEEPRFTQKETEPEPIPLMQITAPHNRPRITPEQSQSSPKQSKESLEAFIGGNLINKIGILILVIGLGIFVKYAIDNNMVGPIGRITGGYLAGLALLGLSYRLKNKYSAYSAVLLSGGVATLYFTTYFAYDFYALLPHALAFALMVAITFFTVYAATLYNQQVIGVIGLVGAYAVPMLLSQNSGKVAILFTYMGMVNIGVAFVAYFKKWSWMNTTAFAITWIIVITWFAVSFTPDRHLAIALGFPGMFFLIFYAIFVFYQLPYQNIPQSNSFFIVTNTIIFFLIGYSALEQAHYTHQTAYFSLGISLVHAIVAWLMHQKKLSAILFYLAVGLSLLFFTMSIDLYFNGLSVSLLWALEALVLCWVAIKSRAAFYIYSSVILVVISTLSLFQLWETAYVESNELGFFTNRYFWSGMGVVFSQAGMLWLTKKDTSDNNPLLPLPIYSIFSNGLAGWAILLLYGVMSLEINHWFNYKIFLVSKTQDIFAGITLLSDEKSIWQLIFSAVYVSALLWISKRYLKEKGWKIVSLLLGYVIVFAWFIVHLSSAEEIRSLFLKNNATGSALSLRYVSYLATGLCLYLMYLQGQEIYTRKDFGRKALSVLIHFFFISVLSFELRNIVMLLSDNPVKAGERILKAGTSILWGCYALGLVAAGIRMKDRTTRFIGILLLAVTLIKLFAMDISLISRLSQIIALLGLGILLMIISFLYVRFKDVIMSEDE
ncbi:DUF2339 domain-containing protein [Xanthocytophaga flava]|uniref:DUF2339 domain-containing protein n=1 Tax=Xanthocytophaga flava TaxID=3048013 RepID=UPI0028D4931E|nr:DUF2339 domain-containing protein [Xanthocytophaga flavus]MDJ1468366.1 DUF2339 domain-containing protein [Xanthocytophaga flavus]